MKKLFLAIFAVFCITGCVVEESAYAQPPLPPSSPAYGCAVVEDSYGEREVCDVHYYTTPSGVVYWDPYFNVWLGAGGYWRSGVWVRGYYPGYWNRYHTVYRVHGWYHSHGYRGYYGSHWHSSGGYHGGSYHGSYHGGHRR